VDIIGESNWIAVTDWILLLKTKSYFQIALIAFRSSCPLGFVADQRKTIKIFPQRPLRLPRSSGRWYWGSVMKIHL
jgi:hypothetical protein